MTTPVKVWLVDGELGLDRGLDDVDLRGAQLVLVVALERCEGAQLCGPASALAGLRLGVRVQRVADRVAEIDAALAELVVQGGERLVCPGDSRRPTVRVLGLVKGLLPSLAVTPDGDLGVFGLGRCRGEGLVHLGLPFACRNRCFLSRSEIDENIIT